MGNVGEAEDAAIPKFADNNTVGAGGGRAIHCHSTPPPSGLGTRCYGQQQQQQQERARQSPSLPPTAMATAADTRD
jgi:hypothetical protein